MKAKIEERNNKLMVMKDLAIDLDAECAEVFANSTAVSRKYPLFRLLPTS